MGCAASSKASRVEVVTDVRVEKPNIPEDLLRCPFSPELTDEAMASQAALYKTFIDPLFAAWFECRQKLDAVRSILMGVK